jgi:hypothetical protein
MPRIVNLANLQPFQAVNLLSDPGAIGGPIVIPSACQVVFAWQCPDSKFGLNVLYGNIGAGFTPTAAIADALKTALTSGAAWTALALQLFTGSGFSAVRLRDVRSANNPFISSATTVVPGTSSSATALPSEVSLAVTLRTARTGPGARGRFYVPCWTPFAQSTTDTVTAGAVTALQNWANGIPAIFAAQGLTLCLGLPARAAYTGTTGTIHQARVAQTMPVTSLLVRDNHWDSQRRRGLK